MAVIEVAAILMCCYAQLVCKLNFKLWKGEIMAKKIKRQESDIEKAFGLVSGNQEYFWDCMYTACNDFEILKTISNIFYLLENQNMLNEAMDLLFAFCMALGIDDIDFYKIYSTPGIKYPFINEFIIMNDEIIEYVQEKIERWDDFDE